MPKRDLERIREILLEVEDVPIDRDEDFYSGFVDFMGKVSPEDAYQLILMRDAGLIEGSDAHLGLFRVTNAGHEYLDAVRDPGIWAKTRAAVAEQGGSAVLEVIKALATGFLRKQISERTGIDL